MSSGYDNGNDNDGHDDDVDSTWLQNNLKDLLNFIFLKWGPGAGENQDLFFEQ